MHDPSHNTTRHAHHVATAHLDGHAPTPGTVYTCPMHPEVRQDGVPAVMDTVAQSPEATF